mmetsp:Transcript_17681/g.40009  ORF Transcript_17681/g.40009 Transcript_17681/m.40009 type:complete len:240 (+) Transcript_17681:54-773(+)
MTGFSDGAPLRSRLASRGILAGFLLGSTASGSLICAIGEQIEAYFAGEVQVGAGNEPCNPTMPECWFPAEIESGPDFFGVYTVSWGDGDTNYREVHASTTRRSLTDEACGSPEGDTGPMTEDDEWERPEIACTIMPQLHWEASEPEWNAHALRALREEFAPDEVLDCFRWHVVFRFYDVDRCEQAYETLNNLLSRCKDPEKCYAHPYVKAVRYIGDDPETRRMTGRHIHKAQEHAREEL